MAVSKAFCDFVQELLAPVGAVSIKRMFGGAGVYADELMFGLIADDTLYLRVDAETEPQFRAAGSEPFVYRMRDGSETSMGYWRAPEEALDDPEQAAPWTRLALEAAVRKRAQQGRKRR